jgi:hypothetical protein
LKDGFRLFCLVEKLWWLEKPVFYLYFLLDFFRRQCNACARSWWWVGWP